MESERKVDELQKKLRQYGVQYVVSPIAIEADPFRYEGKIIACKLHFERMMSATTASFTSGYSDVASKHPCSGSDYCQRYTTRHTFYL